MNKLDSAFDIDPLFSKMSKAFDEGGAKGLLLANLGVGSKGCNIVFDSCQDMNNEADDPANATTATTMRDASLVDISFFTAKLQQEDPVDTLPLVPQLASLRAEHSQLEEEGFVTEEKAAAPKQRRTTNYGVTDEEEREADRSIHQEALERSRASMGRSFVDDDSHDEEPPQHHHHDDDSNDDNNSMGMGGDLFGGDYDDDDNDGDPFAPRFSSISGRSSFAPESQRTSALLDLLSNSQALWTESSNARVYWKAPSTDNQWAGVAHWKKQRPRLAQKEVAATKSNKTPAKTPSKTPKKSSRRRAGPVAVLVDLHSTASLNHLLSSHKSSKKKVGTGWSKTTIAKHTKNENVLPLDAGIGVEQLESLFLRPTGGAIASTQHPPQEAKKTVGFAPDDYFGEDDGGDDDDGGVGFCMGPDGDNDEEEDEFFVPELDDVRKVATIRVGYATVAKKVDVKRLKNELWDEVRTQIDEKQKDDLDDDDQESVMEEEEPKEEASVSDLGLSFQKAVQDMEHAKSQPDVTLPFYFICMLHLANEKGLRLDSQGLDDFIIHAD